MQLNQFYGVLEWSGGHDLMFKHVMMLLDNQYPLQQLGTRKALSNTGNRKGLRVMI